MANEAASADTIDAVVRANPQLNDPATLEGVESLIGKLAPLVQGERFHNLVDLASAVSDVVDMADNAMVQKLAHDYENLAAIAFNLNNAVRYATAQAGADPRPPSVLQSIRRLNQDMDARRGLAMILNLLALLGRDARYSQEVMGGD